MMNEPVQQIWQQCLRLLSDTLAPQIYKTWFEPIEPVSLESTEEGTQLRLKVPNRFFYEWLENRYNTVLTSAVDGVVGVPRTRDTVELRLHRQRGGQRGHLLGGDRERRVDLAPGLVEAP